MRLFVALEPPGEVRTTLAAWAAGAVGEDPELRLVPPEALHLTLVFLGEQDDDAPGRLAPVLAQALGGLREPPRDAHADSVLWLKPRRPHVLTVAVLDPSGRLAELRAQVADACADALGWEDELRPFRPHVTVARVRRGSHVRPRELPALPAAARASWSTGGVTLLRSRTGAGGAQYEALWGATPP